MEHNSLSLRPKPKTASTSNAAATGPPTAPTSSSEPPLAPLADESTSPRTLPDVTHLFAQQRPQNTREQRVGETQETRGTACFQIPLLAHPFHHRLSCGHDIVTTQPEACGINCLEYFTKCMGKKFECPHRQCKQKRAEHNKMFIKKLVIGRKCVLSKAFDGNSGASAVRAKEKDDAIASQLEGTHVGRFATTAPNTFDEDPAMQRAKQQLAANMQTAENAKPKTILHSGVMEPSAVQLKQERCDAAEEDEGQGVRLPGLWMFEQERRNVAKGQAMGLPGLGMLNIQAQEKGMQVSQEGEGQDTGTKGAETQMAMPQQDKEAMQAPDEAAGATETQPNDEAQAWEDLDEIRGELDQHAREKKMAERKGAKEKRPKMEDKAKVHKNKGAGHGGVGPRLHHGSK
ncbi:hypothetical protein MBLNU230_g7399t1 [Neophaeotheca triangularis]